MYHVSIYFDKKCENFMREYMKLVAEQSGNRYMLEAKVPPHITVSAFECQDEKRVVECLKKLEGLKTGRLQWVSVGVFLPYVIFLQPILNEYLHQLSQQVFNCIKEVEGAKIKTCYQPFQWLPHSTIGKKLSQEEMQQAFEVLQAKFKVFEGKVVKVVLARVNPYKEILSWELKE